MSDYDDDFEEYNDTINDRTSKGKTKKAPKDNNDSSYENTFARDKTLGIKPKEYKPTHVKTVQPPSTIKRKSSKGLAKQGGIYSSTPNLGNDRMSAKKSLLGDTHIRTSGKLQNFGLTKKAQQSIKPSKGVMISQLEKLMEDAKTQIEGFQKQQENAENSNLDERLELSLKENKYLQDTLLGMNSTVNQLFSSQLNNIKRYPQTERIKSPPKSAQMRYRTKEVENAQKALDNMMIEYEKLSRRMEVVKDPNYFSNLHTELANIDKQMKELEKENKDLKQEQKRREKEMEKMIAQGAPDTMFQINELQNKVTITKDQLKEEQKQSAEIDALIQSVEEKEKDLKEKEEKLRAEGASLGINFDTTVDETKKQINNDLQNKRDTYQKHLGIAENATKVMKKKLKTMSKVNKTKLKELEKQKEDYERELELKTQQVKEKNEEIAELMTKNKDLQKVRKKDSNQYLVHEKNQNGYDAVEKAIQNQNEKETAAAILIQKWVRIMLARLYVRKLRIAQDRREAERELEEEYDSQGESIIQKKQNTPKRLNQRKDAPVIITKKESFEKPILLDTPINPPNKDTKRENLKKVISKPQLGKKKITSKPF
ncbi:unnamed protein product [Moneuplotes crassus]|uniref:Uncharacterized protein n=2 Tax=Euplotes crassus TaxID=5936 RepID=A0AAD1X9A1_EUPCR|nr:unnamed protein product [Moneuplotes crassus]